MGKKKEKIPPKIPQTVAWTRPSLPQQSAEQYEIQVRDIEKTIDAIQRRCDLLFIGLDDLERSFEWNLHQREDVHTYLKQLLYDREQDLQLLRERFLSLVQKSTDVQDEHDGVVNALHEKFYRTQDELQARAVGLRSRLQLMNEMFEARSALTDEFRSLRKAIHEQDEAYWLKINQSEQDAIRNNADKKKQVSQYLTLLATEFRKASRQAQSIHAREMLKQNITLSTDLRIMSDQTIIVATSNHKLGEKNKQLETDCSMYEDDHKMWQQRINNFEKILERNIARQNELKTLVTKQQNQYDSDTNEKFQMAKSYRDASEELERLRVEQQEKRNCRVQLTLENETLRTAIADVTERRLMCNALLGRACHMLKTFTSLPTGNESETNMALFNRLLQIRDAPAAPTEESDFVASVKNDESLRTETSLDKAMLDIVTYATHLKKAAGVGLQTFLLYEEGDFELVPAEHRSTSDGNPSEQRACTLVMSCDEEAVNEALPATTEVEL